MAGRIPPSTGKALAAAATSISQVSPRVLRPIGLVEGKIAPTPFPYAMHVGTDIASVSRVRKILTGNHGVKFVKRILTGEESKALSAAGGPLEGYTFALRGEGEKKSKRQMMKDEWKDWEAEREARKGEVRAGETMAGR